MLPDGFVRLLEESLGSLEAGCLLKHLDDEPSLSVRSNPFKITKDDLKCHFGNTVFRNDSVRRLPDNRSDIAVNGAAGNPSDGKSHASPDDLSDVPWARDGFYLQNRPSFTLDPLFHCGAYYVQEASSMYVGTLAARYIKDNSRILDLCAAPGGKATDLLSRMGDNSLLVANEVVGNRATVLADNVAKWGSPNVCVTNNDPSAFSNIRNFFDLAVVDAPCSGEGMFRKDEQARTCWSPDNVKMCVSRQRRILSDIWGSLREGGHVIYSTCTFNRYEDEENAQWICSELGAELIEQRRFIPGRDYGEGFYCALLHKNGADSSVREADRKSDKKSDRTNRKMKEANASFKCSNLLNRASGYIADGYVISRKGDILRACPKSVAEDIGFIESNLHAIRSGVAIAAIKGDDLVPEEDLALSNILKRNAFEEAPLSREDSLKFLAREPLTFPSFGKGYLLVTYKGLPLGFVKNLGNRSNNLHPLQRRIRQSIIQL